MKTVYYDKASVDGCLGIFSSGAKVVPAGTAVNAMSVRHKNAAYSQLEETLKIHFIFADCVPEVPFYSVPYLEVIAFDDVGGFLGCLDGGGALLYIDSAGNCFRVAPDVQALLTFDSHWREHIVPEETVCLYPSKEKAMRELEFIEIGDMVK